MRLVARKDWIETPWMTGGTIADIARSPAGADVKTLDWRISVARVERTSPFTHFPGLDRTMLILQGELDLSLERHGVKKLVPTSPPFDFPGDEPTIGVPVGGTALNFNLIRRRDKIGYVMLRRDLAAGESWATRDVQPAQTSHIVFVEDGTVDGYADGTLLTAARHDSFIASSPMSLMARAPARVIVTLVWLEADAPDAADDGAGPAVA